MLAGFPGPPPYGAPPPGPPGPSGPPPPPPPGPGMGGYGPSGYRPPGPKPPGPYGAQQPQQQNGHRKTEPPAGFRSVPPGGKPGAGPAHHHHRGSSQQQHPPSSGAGHAGSSSVIPMAVENRLRRDTPFLAHIRFKNDLPEIPSDPKMLVAPIQPEVLSRFALTSLERQARRDLLTPPNIVISPLDVQRYQVPDQPGPMDPADAALLKEDARALAMGGSPLPNATSDGRNKAFAARTKGMDVDKCSWLMRTTYISSSDNRGIQKQGLPEKQVLQARAAERRAAGGAGADDRELNDVAAQARAIEASFEAARLPPVHSRNPALKPVEILPVLPDMEAWPQKLLLTTFHDSDPAEELAGVVGPQAIAALPPPKRPQLLVGHYLLKGFTHHISKAGQDRELKIMALLVREDIEQMVARTAKQAARQAEREAAEKEGREEQQPGEEEDEEGAGGLAPEDMEGSYQWIKDYNYEYKRDSVHYALRLDKGSARFYRMQGKLELRSWRDEEKLARDRSRKRVMGRAGSEEPAEEDADGSDQVQRPSKIRVTTRDFTDREMQERESKRKELLPAE